MEQLEKPKSDTMSQAEFMRLPLAQRQALSREADGAELRAGPKKTPAARRAAARYAKSAKGKAARAAAYQRDKARRAKAIEAPQDPLFGDSGTPSQRS